MDKRFFFVARKDPFDGDVEVFAPVYKSKLESESLISYFFFIIRPAAEERWRVYVHVCSSLLGGVGGNERR